MIVSLSNIDEFTSADLKETASTFTEAFEMVESKGSFVDTPIPPEFKEVTDMNQISFGHFIILEKMLALDVADNKKMRAIAPYLIRPAKEEYLDNDNEKKENKHIEKVEALPIGSIFGAFNRFIPIRHKYLYKDYNGVIYGTLTEDDDSDDSKDDEDEGTDINSGMGAREGYEQKWFWYNLIGAVADGNIFRRQDAVELPMYEVMPFLAERRHKNIVENLEAKARR